MAEREHLDRQERRIFDQRWRRGRNRQTPSASAVFRFLHAFHHADWENHRQPGRAFIPKPTAPLGGLMELNREMLASLQRHHRQRTATLDMDATLAPIWKRDALFSYKGYKAYQPFNVYWAEQDAVVYSEFRDGNVPAGYEQLRVLREALAYLPQGVERVRLRSDTAGYEYDLMRWCAGGKSERFGVIEFAIGCDVTAQFARCVSQIDERDWKPLCEEIDGRLVPTGREWATVALYVPTETARSRRDPDYTYLATRQPLPGMEGQLTLPFQAVSMKKAGCEISYKISGTVTNMPWSGDRVLRWQYKRCGKSEQLHSIQKEDMAGGRFSSGDFGANTAWWWIMKS